MAGAVFEFSFNPDNNLLRRAAFLGLGAETSFGFDMYEGAGALLYAYTNPSVGVPEPATWSLLAAGFAAMASMGGGGPNRRPSGNRVQCQTTIGRSGAPFHTNRDF